MAFFNVTQHKCLLGRDDDFLHSMFLVFVIDLKVLFVKYDAMGF